MVGASTGNFNGVQVTGSITADNGNSISLSGANPAGSSAPALSLVGATITVGSAPGSLTLGIVNPAIDNDISVHGSTSVGNGGRHSSSSAPTT